MAVMADSIASERIDEVRASILAQVISTGYLEQLVEKQNHWNRNMDQITLAKYPKRFKR